MLQKSARRQPKTGLSALASTPLEPAFDERSIFAEDGHERQLAESELQPLEEEFKDMYVTAHAAVTTAALEEAVRHLLVIMQAADLPAPLADEAGAVYQLLPQGKLSEDAPDSGKGAPAVSIVEAMVPAGLLDASLGEVVPDEAAT